ncbi:MAG: hypothetical protein ACRD4S_00565 [Candidatus Acidiferrales bacterium]
MNVAFLIVGIPAILASFGWLAYMWGWRAAAAVTLAELAALVFAVARIVRRRGEPAPAPKTSPQETGR